MYKPTSQSPCFGEKPYAPGRCPLTPLAPLQTSMQLPTFMESPYRFLVPKPANLNPDPQVRSPGPSGPQALHQYACPLAVQTEASASHEVGHSRAVGCHGARGVARFRDLELETSGLGRRIVRSCIEGPRAAICAAEVLPGSGDLGSGQGLMVGVSCSRATKFVL